jgi:hypothetical protein
MPLSRIHAPLHHGTPFTQFNGGRGTFSIYSQKARCATFSATNSTKHIKRGAEPSQSIYSQKAQCAIFSATNSAKHIKWGAALSLHAHPNLLRRLLTFAPMIELSLRTTFVHYAVKQSKAKEEKETIIFSYTRLACVYTS